MNLTMWSWSLCSIQYDSAAPAIRYGGALLLLGIFVWSIGLLDKKQMRSGVVIMAVFSNIGLAVAYRCTSEEALVLRISDLKDTYAGQTVFIVGGFILVYCVVRFTRIYKTTLWNVAAGVSVLVVAFGARLTGTKTGGSYLYFGNIMVFSWVLLCLPFIASFLLSRKEDAYVGRSVKNLSWNLFILLGYTFVLYLASVLNTEFGLLFLIGATICVLFHVHCKNTNTLAKIFYMGTCAAGALTAAEFVPHIRDRVQLWFHPEVASSTEMKRKAEAVLYLFRYFKKMGWYGRGIGTLSRSRVPTLRSDHVLLTLMNDYSILFVTMVFLLISLKTTDENSRDLPIKISAHTGEILAMHSGCSPVIDLIFTGPSGAGKTVAALMVNSSLFKDCIASNASCSFTDDLPVVSPASKRYKGMERELFDEEHQLPPPTGKGEILVPYQYYLTAKINGKKRHRILRINDVDGQSCLAIGWKNKMLACTHFVLLVPADELLSKAVGRTAYYEQVLNELLPKIHALKSDDYKLKVVISKADLLDPKDFYLTEALENSVRMSNGKLHKITHKKGFDKEAYNDRSQSVQAFLEAEAPNFYYSLVNQVDKSKLSFGLLSTLGCSPDEENNTYGELNPMFVDELIIPYLAEEGAVSI